MTGFIRRWWCKYWFEALLFIFSSALRFYAYHQSPFANGWDSYFYIIQIKSYLEEGQMHSSRYSLFYPLLLLFHWGIQDYELTYQVVSALIVGSFSLSFFSLSKTLNPSSKIPYALGCYTLFSPHLTYFGGQYVKNLLGVVLLLLLLNFLFRPRYLFSIFSLAANLFVHKMTAGLSIMAVLVFVGIKKVPKKNINKLIMLALIAIAVTVGVTQLPGALNALRDRGLVFLSSPHWPTWSFVQTFDKLLTPYWYLDLVLANLAFVSCAVYLIFDRNFAAKWMVLVILLFCLAFPLLQWSVLGLSFRFFMVFALLSPILFNIFSCKKRQVIFPLCGLLVVGSIFSALTYSPKKFDPPYPLYKRLAQKITDKSDEPGYQFELIIAHKSLAEYITFSTGIDVLPWQPEYPVKENKLWRLATGLNAKSIAYFSGKKFEFNKAEFLSANYFLIREDQWQQILMNLKIEDEALYQNLMTWKNPHQFRPGYLLNNQK